MAIDLAGNGGRRDEDDGRSGLLTAYAQLSETAERLPTVVWLQIAPSLAFPAPGKLVSLLMTQHVDRNVSALLRHSRRKQALEASPESGDATARMEALLASLSHRRSYVVVRLLFILAFIAALLMAFRVLRLVNPRLAITRDPRDFDRAETAVRGLIEGAFSLDVGKAFQSLTSLDSFDVVYVLLIPWLAATTVVFGPAVAAFASKRRLLSLWPEAPKRRARLPRPSHPILNTGAYRLEYELFDHQGLRRPHEIAVDLLTGFVLLVPFLLVSGVLFYESFSRPSSNFTSDALEALFELWWMGLLIAALLYIRERRTSGSRHQRFVDRARAAGKAVRTSGLAIVTLALIGSVIGLSSPPRWYVLPHDVSLVSDNETLGSFLSRNRWLSKPSLKTAAMAAQQPFPPDSSLKATEIAVDHKPLPSPALIAVRERGLPQTEAVQLGLAGLVVQYWGEVYGCDGLTVYTQWTVVDASTGAALPGWSVPAWPQASNKIDSRVITLVEFEVWVPRPSRHGKYFIRLDWWLPSYLVDNHLGQARTMVFEV